MKTLRYVLKYKHWPSRNQRDFMSGNPLRQARVRAFADQIIAEMEPGQ